MLGIRSPSGRRLLALTTQRHGLTCLAGLVKKCPSLAHRPLGLAQPFFIQRLAYLRGHRSLLSLARFQLLLILDHPPMGVVETGFAGAFLLVRPEQHGEAAGGHERREDGEEKSDGHIAESIAGTALDEKRDAQKKQHGGNDHAECHLNAPLRSLAAAIGLIVGRFLQSLVHCHGGCVVRASHLHGMGLPRLTGREVFQAVTQGPLVGGRQAGEAAPAGTLVKFVVVGCLLLALGQPGDIPLKLVAFGIQSRQRTFGHGERLNHAVGLFHPLPHGGALGLQLVQLAILGTIGIGDVSRALLLGTQGVAPGQKLGDRLLGRGGAGGECRQALVHMSEGVGRRRTCARTGRQQLRRRVRRVAQRAQFIAVQGKHRAIGVLVDVFHQEGVSLQAVGIAGAGKHERLLVFPRTRARVRPRRPREKQRARSLGPLGLVGVPVSSSLFPTEQHAAHKGGHGRLARLVGAEDDVHAIAEGPDHRIVKAAEALQVDRAKVDARLGHRSSPPCSSKSSTSRAASFVSWRAFFSESAAVRGTLRARYSSCK